MIFGNLTFSHYAPSTESERQILSLQAALTLLGVPEKPSPSLKKLLRLKKAMQKNKLRKYTFELIPVKQPEAVPLPVKTQEASDCLDLIQVAVQKVTSLSVATTEVKLTTSGHRLLQLTLHGDKCEISPDDIKREVAKQVLTRHRKEIPSFILQSCVRSQLEKVVTISLQCVYKVADVSA